MAHITYRKSLAQQRAEAQAKAAALLRKKQEEEEKKRQEGDPLLRSISTVGDVLSNVVTGALKGVEGVVDLGIGIVGGVGGLFSEDFREGAESIVEYDASNEWVGKHLQELTKYSYTNNNDVGEIVEGISMGVGQLLPAVIVSIATGGTGTPSQIASLATTMSSAAGNATEEAYQDGADYYQGLAYGAASGAVEGATEKIFGGGTGKLFGKGMADGAVKGVAKQGAARIAKEALEEGVEEVAAEVASPALKTIYKGTDALREYGEGDYWKSVAEAGIIGAGTSVAYGGSVGRVLNRGGNADIDASLESIRETERAADRLSAKRDLTDSDFNAIRETVKGNLQNVEKVLKKAAPEKRAKLIKNYGFEGAFDSDGSLRADYMAQSGLNASEGLAVAESANGSQEQNSAYLSPSLSLQMGKVSSDLSAITENLQKMDMESGGTGKIADVTLFRGTLSERGRAMLGELKKAVNTLSEKAGGNIKFAIVSPNEHFDAVNMGNTVYIGADVLESGAWAGKLIHEVTHFAEGSKEYAQLMKLLYGDSALLSDTLDAVVNEKNYGFSREAADSLKGKMGGNVALDKAAGVQYNRKRAKYIPYSTIGEDNVNVIRRQLTQLYQGVESGIADGIAIENGNAVYIVDSGKENGEIAFGVRKKITFQDAEYRKIKLEEINDRAISKGYVSEQLLEKIGRSPNQYSRSDIGRELQGELSLDTGKSEYHQGRISNADADRGGRGLSTEDQQNVVDPSENVNTQSEEFLTLEEQALLRETNAHLSEKILGADEAFVERLLRSDETVVEKILNRIDDAKRRLASLQNTDTRKEYNRLRKAEKLYLKAVERAGMTYRQGRIVMRREDEPAEGKSTGIQFSRKVEEYPYDMQKVIREYLHSGDSVIKNMVLELQTTGNLEFKRHTIGKLSEKNIKDLQRLTGLDYTGYSHAINSDAIRHIETRHGINGKANKSMANPDDVARISYVVDHYDAIEYVKDDNGKIVYSAYMDQNNNPAPLVVYKKKINGTYYFVEAAGENAYKKLWAVSAYIAKEELTHVSASDNDVSRQLTSETLHASRSSKNSIRDNEPKVKSKTQFSLKNKNSSYANNWSEVAGALTEEPARKKSGEMQALQTEETKGEPAKKKSNRGARLVKQKETIDRLQKRLGDIHDIEKAERTALYLVQKIDDAKKGNFLNSSQLRDDRFRGSVEALSKLRYRGNLRKGEAVRSELKKLWSWYVDPHNQLFTTDNGYFLNDISLLLQGLSHGTGELTLSEMRALNTVLNYFKHTIDTFNKVYKNGKYVDAEPLAKRYVERVQQTKRINPGILSKIRAYFRNFGDPAAVMRFADRYNEKGFFTETYEELRKGAIGAAVTEAELMEAYESFINEKGQKAYQKHLTDDTVEYKDTKIPVRYAISLYMTHKRQQAWGALCRTGVAMDIDGEGQRKKFSALDPDPKKKFSDAEMKALTESAAASLYKQFSERDKQLIRIAEETFGKCSPLKEQADMLRFGFSNTMKSGYYYPIRRTNLAKNVDNESFFAEVDRVSHLGFNQDTVKGAVGELLIEPIDRVLTRHVHGIAMYANLALPTDNLNRILNLNTGSNPNNPNSVLSQLESTQFGKDMYAYLEKMKKDIEGVPSGEKDSKEFNKIVGTIRGSYAKYQLGANPKVLATQFSSLFAATSMLDYDSVVKGIGVAHTLKEVDQYCPLAKLRNADNTAALAQGVMEKTGKIGDVLMKPIGWTDRLVISRLFGACQLQVKKDQGLALGTVENKKAAGELLTRVILETQQNALMTERSSAMRSSNELLRSLTMFSADAMKTTGRLIDSIGEVSTLRHLLKTASEKDRPSWEKQLKAARRKLGKSVASVVTGAIFMALVAQGFRWLYRKDEDKEPGEVARTMAGDTVGNMLGGLPFLRDVYSYFCDGYEMENFIYATVNDTLSAANGLKELAGQAIDGKPISSQEIASKIRNLMYAAGQLTGIPVRNTYNTTIGLIRRASPTTGYQIDSTFYNQNYSSDLAKAMEKGDDKMVTTIAGLITDENFGGQSAVTRKAIRELVADGYHVLPRSVGDSVTYNGETVELTAAQQKKFRTVYDIADKSVDALTGMSQFVRSEAAVKAKAIKFIYDVYYELALSDTLGLDLATKNVLFAEAIDLEKLAIIVATAQGLTADVDKNGNPISGSRKKKIVAYIESLELSAAQKHMILGYLGYANGSGKEKVESYIERLSLTKEEKKALLGFSGYAA